MKSSSRYLCDLIKQTTELKLGSVDERAANYILSRADIRGTAATIVLSEGHGIAAQRLGMSPESFSRALRRLRRLGIEAQGRHISISDTDRLRDYCGVTSTDHGR
jgi:CRP-like cAMP-binding protein